MKENDKSETPTTDWFNMGHTHRYKLVIPVGEESKTKLGRFIDKLFYKILNLIFR